MKKSEVKVKKTIDLYTANALLDDFVKSFREGTVCIENGQEFVTLKPSKQINIEIEAVQKKDKEKLTIELSWRQSTTDKPENNTLKISSSEPAIESSMDVEESDSNDEDDIE